jgi:FKBP-type peptidyl-prolyl cis-trans isomerase
MSKKIITSVFIMAVSATLCCGAGNKSVSSGNSDNVLDADTSYAFGVVLGSDLKQTGLHFDYKAFTEGFQKSVEGQTPRISMEDAFAKVQSAFSLAMEQRATNNLEEGRLFLADNGKKAGVKTTASGLQYEVIREGTGAKPSMEDVVLVQYEGKLVDGTIFDSTKEDGQAVEIPLYGVIPGWSEGLQLMSGGSSYRLYIPPELGYGEDGAGGSIPPNAVLIFEVELVEIIAE